VGRGNGFSNAAERERKRERETEKERKKANSPLGPSCLAVPRKKIANYTSKKNSLAKLVAEHSG
jgi:hypothetical protein